MTSETSDTLTISRHDLDRVMRHVGRVKLKAGERIFATARFKEEAAIFVLKLAGETERALMLAARAAGKRKE